MNKEMIIILAILLVLTPLVSAEFWACFEKGEITDFCNPKTPDRTCGSTYGCSFCMYSYNGTANCYNQGSWNVCNTIDKECTDVGGNTTIDSKPPVLTINNPKNNSIYNKRAVLFDLEADEESDISYIDNNDDRGIWKRICQECLSYNNSRSFKEGENNITIRAEDVLGNPSFFDVFFFVDSKKPIIKKIEPRNNAYVNSIFTVTYYEDNPNEIWLTYGNNITGYREEELVGCSGGKREKCEIDVDLGDYDGQEIEFWFNMTDIAGNFVESRIGKVKVDITPPVINSLDYNINGKYVAFTLNITEENFDSVEYYDNNDSRPRWRRLCSRLRDGICVKRVSFKVGSHDVDIQVLDEAGNSIGESISFVI